MLWYNLSRQHNPSFPATRDSSLHPWGWISFDSLTTTLSYCEIWDRWSEREDGMPGAAFKKDMVASTKHKYPKARHARQWLHQTGKSLAVSGDGTVLEQHGLWCRYQTLHVSTFTLTSYQLNIVLFNLVWLTVDAMKGNQLTGRTTSRTKTWFV